MDVGLAAALAGGALTLLSPCSALLLPAFFASSVGSGPRLLVHGAVFYVGLVALLLPVGVGLGAAGRLVVEHRSTIVAVTSLVLIVLGLFALLGRGLDLTRLAPGSEHLTDLARSRTGLVKSLLLGAAAGAASFCTGPILGAVLTLAAARGDVAGAAVLLCVYAIGMVIPMLILVVLWRRIGDRARHLLFGTSFTVAGREWNPVQVVTGLVLIVAGVAYWLTDGLVGVGEPVPASVRDRLQDAADTLARPGVDVVLIVVAVAGLLWAWSRARARADPR
ncbi:sulfite exporter TauE/SafE family protein [Gordonia sp. HY442]|uniref:cytochrome c biogenesis CcdA family protein n=1 Tax=Gordonia zhenghanii TaxID=2911516 RepID=UPI001F477E7E|nr:cytochrome c biogenesis protein CcdA [Gordonia zhenghanii]MCF8601884.1 sulfite exporter TauE/SafE family protein [Gordonia zhenghanii]